MDDEENAQTGKRQSTWVVPAIAIAAVAMVVAGVAVGFGVGNWRSHTTTVTVAGTTQPPAGVSVSPVVAAGAHTFVQFACSQCHGPQGQGGVSPYVPALTSGRQGADRRAADAHHQPRARRVGEPDEAVHAGLGRGAVEDAGARTSSPTSAPACRPCRRTSPSRFRRDRAQAVAGAALYVRYGCINCHGPSGLGGVPNPLSPDKSIPPLVGRRLPSRLPDGRGDRRRDPQRQRDRQGADREHAALGRDHPGRPTSPR